MLRFKYNVNMNLSPEYKTILDDFQHQVEHKINLYGSEASFPQRAQHLSEDSLSDYLFEIQAALDSFGSTKSQYTIAGFLMCLPIIIISAFPDDCLPFKDFYNVLLAIGVGLVLFATYWIISKLMIRNKINNVNKAYPEVKAYVDKVLAYK